MSKWEKGGIVVSIIGILALVTGAVFWTDRNLDWALTRYAGHAVNCPLWLSAVVSFLGNGVAFFFNIVCEILRLVKP